MQGKVAHNRFMWFCPKLEFTRSRSSVHQSLSWDIVLKYGIVSSCVLEWSDGYYNGNIKTRKTVQPEEVNEDQLGLQKTEQLRELCSSLLTGESEEDLQPQDKRLSAALCPEDLIDIDGIF
ncbi:hypothetical protein T459_28162 [Capsicum annuum]|uniref:Uncharacterized protein n=1 Tax=Capsicum annuum TaxID=4072 RepID=A0A2G2YG27_CAPAN|nr:hypothetical protein T459_28162 [Capsicum annuum]